MIDVPTDKDYTAQINEIIENFFTRSIADASLIDTSYAFLWNSLYELMKSGGKRLRPKITMLAYEAFGGQDVKKALPVAVAHEFLHFSLLIHDDIIDRDYTRYGVANIAGRYKIAYSKHLASPAELTHFSHSAAILAGDLMLSTAHHMVATSEFDRERKLIADKYISRGIFEVAGGELLDTELSFMPYDPGDAIKVANYKTSSYSFVAPLLTGAALAKATDDQLQNLREFAVALGIAYQLADDLLGIFGDESQTGKSTVSDILEGKRTYLVEKALGVFSSEEKTSFMLAFGNVNATALEIETAKQLLRSSGAETKTQQKIAECNNKAYEYLSKLSLKEPYNQIFLDLISKVSERSR